MLFIHTMLNGYRRNVIYPLLGFNNIKFRNDLSELKNLRSYPDDISTYKNIISLFKNKDKNEKIFNFTVTMQNHGYYNYQNFKTTVKYIGKNEYPQLNQYLTLIKKSDEALKYLINYFKEYKEPTIIMFFGDHQPSIEKDFYEYLFSKSENVNIEKKFITPFLIWANYDINEIEIDDISTNYLSTILLETAGLKPTSYNKFLKQLYEKIPVITNRCYMDYNRCLSYF